MTTGRWVIFLVWLTILAIILYLYLFQSEVFQHIFQYPGAGSPYINTPSGGGR